ncbi:uncharacterized protein LOC112521790 [Cynara cardunculus var. scolymus]|uniref:uncharacterized protein LOC112521790 n=1 Tax=Cynara cardunculus var. scolymus TaxID=59895 RepID=UPI000D6260B2|nr:uncharacterized protein LOC112521790 [Cynara cardunculus var. scolymus]
MCWIKEIEFVFNIIRCSETDKVRFAVSILKSNALFWWEVELLAKIEILQTLSWAEFVNKFKEQFLTKAVVRQMEEDFLKLEQGTKTVQEYTEKFIEYSQFIEHYISSESRNVERYIWGLKPSIREFVIAMNLAMFSLTIDATEVTERNKNRQEEGKVTEKRKWERPSTGYRGPKYVTYGNRPVQKISEKACFRCHQIHQGDCKTDWRKCYQCGKADHLSRNCPMTKRCFNCNSPDHLRPNCPQLKAPQLTMGSNTSCARGRSNMGRGGQGRVRGRSFQMTKHEAETTPDVVTCTFLVNSLYAKVLLDSSANFSFISPSFAKCACMNFVPLDDKLVVDTANS